MTADWSTDRLRALEEPVGELVSSTGRDLIRPAQSRATLQHGDEPVTDIDLAAEEMLTAGLRKILPVAEVIGEESAKAIADGGGDPFAPLRHADQPVWIVDPIDGTGNYASGSHDYGSMVALVVGDTTVAAWIWSAARDSLYATVLSSGVRRDGAKLPPARPRSGPARVQVLDRYMEPDVAAAARAVIDGVEATSVEPIYCAASDYPSMVEGDLDLSVYRRVRPWDHLAGVLLVREAGGSASDLAGRAYTPSVDARGLVVAADGVTTEAISRPLIHATTPFFAND